MIINWNDAATSTVEVEYLLKKNNAAKRFFSMMVSYNPHMTAYHSHAHAVLVDDLVYSVSLISKGNKIQCRQLHQDLIGVISLDLSSGHIEVHSIDQFDVSDSPSRIGPDGVAYYNAVLT